MIEQSVQHTIRCETGIAIGMAGKLLMHTALTDVLQIYYASHRIRSGMTVPAVPHSSSLRWRLHTVKDNLKEVSTYGAERR